MRWGLLLALTVAGLAVIAPVLNIKRSLLNDEAFALIRSQTVVSQPNVTHSRFRLADYVEGTNNDRFFFQWWNYLIDSPSADEPFQIITQINHFSNKLKPPVNLSSSATNNEWFVAGLKHGSIQASLQVPLADVTLSASMDIEYRSPDKLNGQSKYNQVFIIQKSLDDNTYLVEGLIPVQAAAPSHQNVKYVSFSSVFHRVHGVYTGLDREADNIKQCTVISNHFAYDSIVGGTWIELDESLNELHQFTFSTSVNRGYAAGSWGCQLPSGEPAVNYPWTWAWLSIPASSGSSDAKDKQLSHPAIGICVGSATFDGTWILGDIAGSYALIGIGGQSITASSTAKFHAGSMLEIPVISTTNDQYLSHLNISLSDWQIFKDELGSAELPMTQVYDVSSSSYHLTLTLTARSSNQFFRAPVIVEVPAASSHVLAMFSDFRAVNVDAHVRLVHRQNRSVIYDGPAAMNAVEYAYRAALNTDVGSAMNLML